MKGKRIFEISPDGVREISIAQRAVMQYTCENEDKMMKYVMSFDVSQADQIAKDFIFTAVMFVLEYTKQVNDSIPDGEMPTKEDIDRLMANSQDDLQEFLHQHIDKRFAEVY